MKNSASEVVVEDYKQDVLKRLKRVEGQIRGIQKMIEEEKYCPDILTQIAAARAAINRVGALVLEKHSKTCVEKALSSGGERQLIDDMLDSVQKFLKFID